MVQRRTLSIAMKCPRCGARPALHVYRSEVERLKTSNTPPEEPMHTHECKRCGAVYTIEARAYLEAS